MPKLSSEKTAQLLEAAHKGYASPEERALDPVVFAHRYSDPKDQEVAGFLAALLAYGNVQTILKSVERVLLPLGKNPSQFVRKEKLTHLWNDFTHRFTTGEDIEIVCEQLKALLNSHGSIEAFFNDHSQQTSPDLKSRLSDFVRRLTNLPVPARLVPVAKRRARNLKYLISDPARGSACKRLNMYLRWMVRPNDGIDLGIWTGISPKDLILPIDTHLLQTLHRLKWTKSKQANWKVAEQATEKLRSFSPKDPIRYDFALCHLSMRGINIETLE